MSFVFESIRNFIKSLDLPDRIISEIELKGVFIPRFNGVVIMELSAGKRPRMLTHPFV